MSCQALLYLALCAITFSSQSSVQYLFAIYTLQNNFIDCLACNVDVLLLSQHAMQIAMYGMHLLYDMLYIFVQTHLLGRLWNLQKTPK